MYVGWEWNYVTSLEKTLKIIIYEIEQRSYHSASSSKRRLIRKTPAPRKFIREVWRKQINDELAKIAVSNWAWNGNFRAGSACHPLLNFGLECCLPNTGPGDCFFFLKFYSTCMAWDLVYHSNPVVLVNKKSSDILFLINNRFKKRPTYTPSGILSCLLCQTRRSGLLLVRLYTARDQE